MGIQALSGLQTAQLLLRLREDKTGVQEKVCQAHQPWWLCGRGALDRRWFPEARHPNLKHRED